MIYVLYGSDGFSRSKRLRGLKGQLDADGSLESNTVEFDAREVTPAEVIAACSTVPFLGGRRLVVVEGVLRGGGSPGGGRRRRSAGSSSEVQDGEEKGPWWALVGLAEAMPETTTLVLVDGDAVDEKLLDALKPFATVEKVSLPFGKDVVGWVQDRARERGVQIEPRACAMIADLIGNDTWMLASEIEKLAVFANGERVTEADVKALVPDVRDRAGYLLADAVAEGKPAEATKILHQLLQGGHVPAVLLLTMENRYRRMAVAREMMDAGATSAQIGPKVSMSGYGLERLLDQASRTTMERVRRALDRIAQSDQDVKEGRFDNDRLSLEILVQDLASAGRGGGQRVSAASGSSW